MSRRASKTESFEKLLLLTDFTWHPHQKILIYSGQIQKEDSIVSVLVAFDIKTQQKYILRTSSKTATQISFDNSGELLCFNEANVLYVSKFLITDSTPMLQAYKQLVLEGNTAVISNVISPDGKKVAFVHGSEVKIWDIQTGQVGVLPEETELKETNQAISYYLAQQTGPFPKGTKVTQSVLQTLLELDIYEVLVYKDLYPPSYTSLRWNGTSDKLAFLKSANQNYSLLVWDGTNRRELLSQTASDFRIFWIENKIVAVDLSTNTSVSAIVQVDSETGEKSEIKFEWPQNSNFVVSEIQFTAQKGTYNAVIRAFNINEGLYKGNVESY